MLFPEVPKSERFALWPCTVAYDELARSACLFCEFGGAAIVLLK